MTANSVRFLSDKLGESYVLVLYQARAPQPGKWFSSANLEALRAYALNDVIETLGLTQVLIRPCAHMVESCPLWNRSGHRDVYVSEGILIGLWPDTERVIIGGQIILAALREVVERERCHMILQAWRDAGFPSHWTIGVPPDATP